jgi:pyridoxamine 5'-phosphate oxidase
MGERKLEELDEYTVDRDPIKQFQHWYDAVLAAGVAEPDAMTLVTAPGNGRPSARMVLLKLVDSDGFVFYTNYNSRKGRELAANPVAALVFFWAEFHRQVRVEGTVKKVSPEESDAYFRSRPRDGQLSSLASAQSEVVRSRSELDARFEDLRKKYEGKPIPRPAHWGGYRLAPERMEFWQARFARLNDRVLYELQRNGSWLIRRLAP